MMPFIVKLMDAKTESVPIEFTHPPCIIRRKVSLLRRRGPSAPEWFETVFTPISPCRWFSQRRRSSDRMSKSGRHISCLDYALRRPVIEAIVPKSRAGECGLAKDTKAEFSENRQSVESHRFLMHDKTHVPLVRGEMALQYPATGGTDLHIPIMSRPRPATRSLRGGRPNITIQIPETKWNGSVLMVESAGLIDRFVTQPSVAAIASVHEDSPPSIISERAILAGPWSAVSPAKSDMIAKMSSDDQKPGLEDHEANNDLRTTSLLTKRGRTPSSSESSAAYDEDLSRSTRSSVTSFYSDSAPCLSTKDLLQTPGMTGSAVFSINDPILAGVFDDEATTCQRLNEGSNPAIISYAKPSLTKVDYHETARSRTLPLTPLDDEHQFRYPEFPLQGLRLGSSHSFRSCELRTKTLLQPQPTPCATPTSWFSHHGPPSGKTLKHQQRTISAEVAENIVLKILQCTHSLDDLFSTALINRGFYGVFKRNELHLMKRALRTESPPAWELRELVPPSPEDCSPHASAPIPDYTPSSYMQYYNRDSCVVSALRSVIMEQCNSFLRPRTVAALSGTDAAKSGEIDQAIWRIWTFCMLFGSRKGRERDIACQIDWLQGGKMALQTKSRDSVVESSDPVTLSSALPNPPESFGRGNSDGLSAEQLIDMLEIWTCLRVLIGGIRGEGRVAQAREHGIFLNSKVKVDDIEKEELLLEEWIDHLLTLGPPVVLSLHPPSTLPTVSVFILAKRYGWTAWDPSPTNMSSPRRVFLKEAVSRLYEERMAAYFPNHSEQKVHRFLQTQTSRQRLAHHREDILRRRLGPEYKLLPPVRHERPMSEWADRGPLSIDGEGTYQSPFVIEQTPSWPSRSPAARSAAPMPVLPTPVTTCYQVPTTSKPGPPPTRSTAPAPPSRHPLRAATQPHSRSTPPLPTTQSIKSREAVRKSYEDIRTARLSRTSQGSVQLQNSDDEAVFKLVDMGFTAKRARWALATTGDGRGLSLERAVGLLLG